MGKAPPPDRSLAGASSGGEAHKHVRSRKDRQATIASSHQVALGPGLRRASRVALSHVPWSSRRQFSHSSVSFPLRHLAQQLLRSPQWVKRLRAATGAEAGAPRWSSEPVTSDTEPFSFTGL